MVSCLLLWVNASWGMMIFSVSVPFAPDWNGLQVGHEPEICDDKRYLTLNTAELLPNMCDNHQCM